MYVRIRATLEARSTDVLHGRLVRAGELFPLAVEAADLGSGLAEAEALGNLVSVDSVEEVRESWEPV
jgi:hypothetical protein